jgi:hypothetical protein
LRNGSLVDEFSSFCSERFFEAKVFPDELVLEEAEGLDVKDPRNHPKAIGLKYEAGANVKIVTI